MKFVIGLYFSSLFLAMINLLIGIGDGFITVMWFYPGWILASLLSFCSGFFSLAASEVGWALISFITLIIYIIIAMTMNDGIFQRILG